MKYEWKFALPTSYHKINHWRFHMLAISSSLHNQSTNHITGVLTSGTLVVPVLTPNGRGAPYMFPPSSRPSSGAAHPPPPCYKYCWNLNKCQNYPLYNCYSTSRWGFIVKKQYKQCFRVFLSRLRKFFKTAAPSLQVA